jgi:uncharacterized protein YegL
MLASRSALDICFVIDISGSMSSRFPDDSDNRSKLEIAIDSVRSILPKLNERDRVAIILFNNDQRVLCPLSHCNASHITKIKSSLNTVSTSGGTSLGKGLASGLCTLFDAPAPTSSTQHRYRRVIFLTDMESSTSDENLVIGLSKNAATAHVTPMARVPDGGNHIWGRQNDGQVMVTMESFMAESARVANSKLGVNEKSVFVSIVGVGVDLSAHTVERICAIPGARYISAVTAQEFTSIVAEEFEYDVTPIAFDIKLTLPGGLSVERVYGASELNSTPAGATSIALSSEFANPLQPDGSTKGGVVILQLREELPPTQSTPAKRRASRTNTSVNAVVEWRDKVGERHRKEIRLNIPRALEADESVSEGCDVGLRKAVALVQYVRAIEEYALDTDADTDGDAQPSEATAELAAALNELKVPGLLGLESLSHLPQPVPEPIIKAHKYILRFNKLRSHLISELGACGDSSLSGDNRNVLQTIGQVVELETKELETCLTRVAHVRRHSGDTADCPKSFLCPITLEIMQDPVIGADGHSYERSAIKQWLTTHDTSPVTNLPMTRRDLLDNHSLRCAIDEYVAAREADSGDAPHQQGQRSTPRRSTRSISGVATTNVEPSSKRRRRR